MINPGCAREVTHFTEKVIQIMRDIPSGKVMTYGQIAALAGIPRGARQVVRILHSMSRKHQLPWHRVINMKGRIAIRDNESYFMQIALLRMEGVEVNPDGEVDLAQYLWHP